ncbi:MAG: xanthine dehydrogenase family protein molybdopterin-binding subunit [bacterium]|nr:xanthine dehydrogenase family protein molybdopterin-binding subunit [bacterium]
MPEYALLGKSLPKPDATNRVTGRMMYADDVTLPGVLAGKILGSPVAHGRIRRLDVSKAASLPGVHAVLTAQDAPTNLYGGIVKDKLIFTHDYVRYHGDPIAAVAADNVDIAEEAIHLIELDIEALPVLLDAKDAAESSNMIHSGWEHYTALPNLGRDGNITSYGNVQWGDVEQGFAKADFVYEDRFDVAMAHQGYIEPRASMAQVEPDGRVSVWASTQGIFPLRDQLASIFSLPMNRLRVIATEIGGGFGGKIAPVTEPATVLLAQKTGRPIKITYKRDEDFLSTTPRRGAVIIIKTGVMKDGTLVARQARAYFGNGAYHIATGYNFGEGMAGRLTGPYNIPHVDLHGYTVYTNQPPCGAYRAPGSPQLTFAVESQMDMIASRLGFDPIAIRKHNALKIGDRSSIGALDDAADLRELLQQVETDAGWNKPKASNHGRGIAVGFWASRGMPGGNTVKLNADGTIAITTGSVDVSGSHTVLQQIAGEEMGVSIDKVGILTGDTDVAPVAPLSAGSNIIRSMGWTVKVAAEKLRQQIVDITAGQLEANVDDLEIIDGRVQVKGTPDKGMTFQDVYKVAAMSHEGPPIASASTPMQGTTLQYAPQVAEVEVDLETGEVKVLDVTVIQDVGFALNPMAVEGQMEGGATQALGYGIVEQMIFDPTSGKNTNPGLLDYKLPSAMDVPNIKSVLVQVPAKDTIYGARGVGEPPIVATATAIANAVADAVGVQIMALPLTPERVLEAIRKR